MGRMTDDITRLCDEIIAGRAKRADFLAGVKDTVENLREATVEMRADFREAHATMAANTKVALEEAVEQIKRRVVELKKQSADMLQAMRQTHDEMARDQRVELNAFISDLANSVTTMLDGFLDARANMAAAAQAELGGFCDGLRRDATALQNEAGDLMAAIRKAQSEAARNSREDRLSFLAEQVAFVSQFMDQVAEMMDGVRREQERDAAEGRDSRLRFVSELRTDVAGQQVRFAQERRSTSREVMDQLKLFEEEIKLQVKELRAAVEIMRREFLDDLAGASAAWQGRRVKVPGVVPAKQKPAKVSLKIPVEPAEKTKLEPAREWAEEPAAATEAKPAKPEPVEKTPVQAEKKPEVKESGKPLLDQLTVIKGIGPRIQSKLYLAGIDTFAKLAKSDPARLREILGQVARTANVASWIEQAKKLI